MTTIHAAQALVDGRIVGPVRLELDGLHIVSIVTGTAAEQGPAADIELGTGTLTPGMLDLQNNGSFGADFADATPKQWADVLTGLASRGVTGLEPTIITAPLDELNAAFGRIHDAQQQHADEPVSRILGAHLEGPFISERRKGAHRAECMTDPTRGALDTLLDNPATAAVLLTVTLKTERPHALEAIRRLAARGVVVSVGHSDATADQVWAAADAGATMTTHIFNAQRPLQHREPGVAGAVLASCTEVAARSIRRPDLGHLTTGALADLVWWDEQWHPRRVWIGATEIPTSPDIRT